MGMPGITPTFCIIKFCQARCALGGILGTFSLRLHSWNGILYFLKILEKPRSI
jgi:hypothetical protein